MQSKVSLNYMDALPKLEPPSFPPVESISALYHSARNTRIQTAIYDLAERMSRSLSHTGIVGHGKEALAHLLPWTSPTFPCRLFPPTPSSLLLPLSVTGSENWLDKSLLNSFLSRLSFNHRPSFLPPDIPIEKLHV